MLIQSPLEKDIKPRCLYKDLPSWIKKIAAQRAMEDKDPISQDEWDNISVNSLFTWSETPEEHHVWSELFNNGNVKPLLQFHQSKKK